MQKFMLLCCHSLGSRCMSTQGRVQDSNQRILEAAAAKLVLSLVTWTRTDTGRTDSASLYNALKVSVAKI